MIEIERSIRRANLLWRVDNEKVGNYLKMLSRTKKQLTGDSSYEIRRILKIDDDLLSEIIREIDREIELCKFYFEYQKRQRGEDFNKWVYLTREQRKKREKDWQIKGDCWTKTNGRIRATITIDKSGVMAKIEVSYQNDAENLKFYDDYYDRTKPRYRHRKTEKGINEQIEKYKQEAREIFEELQYPLYCREKKAMDTLKQLLHIRESVLLIEG